MNEAVHYQQIIEEIAAEVTQLGNPGEVAAYIPELGHVPAGKFGICLIDCLGNVHSVGDSKERFSIQSIAKVLSLVMAFRLEKDRLWQRVGVEPSGTAFNSLVQLEIENGVPRNPLINAGALVVCDVLVSCLREPKHEIIEFVRTLCGSTAVDYCDRVARSEAAHGFRNAANINLMKAYGNIHNEIDEVLELYFNLCSIELTCEELAAVFRFLAEEGVNPQDGKQVISGSMTRRINAIMMLCGFYDEAGEFAFRVGLPGKSGVGGGIVAVEPRKYSVAVWSPPLNQKGNSFLGMKVLESLTTRTGSSVF